MPRTSKGAKEAGVETLVGKLVSELEGYTDKYHAIARKGWEGEYESEGFKKHGKIVELRAP